MAKDNTNADTTKKPDASKKPAKAPNKAHDGRSKKPGPFARLMDYFRGVRSELKRVTWPTRREVLNSCVIVVVTLVFFAAFTTVTDTGSTTLVTLWGKIGRPSTETSGTATPQQSTDTTAAAQNELDALDAGTTSPEAVEDGAAPVVTPPSETTTGAK